MMNETTLYKKLSRRLRLLKDYNIELTRIESGGTRVGIPDIYYSTENTNGWIELKQIHTMQTEKAKIPWRAGQRAWIKRHIELNDNIWIAITDKYDRLLWLIPRFWYEYVSWYVGHKLIINDKSTGERIYQLLNQEQHQ